MINKLLNNVFQCNNKVNPTKPINIKLIVTKMKTFIKTKFNKSDDQTNIDNIE